MWIALLAAVAIALLAWVLAPILGARRSWAPRERASVEEQLLAERGKLLRALKDLEHEREAGTIGADEYEELRGDYLAETAAVYRRLEELGVRTEDGR
jgi:hypothetical protein